MLIGAGEGLTLALCGMLGEPLAVLAAVSSGVVAALELPSP